MQSAIGGNLFGQSDRVANCPSDFCQLKKKVFSSWDQFQIPYPGGKGLFVWGQPIWVKGDLPNDELSGPGLELEKVFE